MGRYDYQPTKEEHELAKKLEALVKENTRPGTRVVFNTQEYPTVRIFCGGTLPFSGYVCGLSPGHKDKKCYCAHKAVDFKPEEGTERATQQRALKDALANLIPLEPFTRESQNHSGPGWAEAFRADMVDLWLETLDEALGSLSTMKLNGVLLPTNRTPWDKALVRESRSTELSEGWLEDLWYLSAPLILKAGPRLLPDDMELFFDAGPSVRRVEAP